MWSPIILLCLTTNWTECIAIGGPIGFSKTVCEKSITHVGLPYLRKKYPEKFVSGYQCVAWNTEI